MLIISSRTCMVRKLFPTINAKQNGKHTKLFEKKRKLHKQIQVFRNENMNSSKWDEFDDLIVSLQRINNEIDEQNETQDGLNETIPQLNLGMLG